MWNLPSLYSSTAHTLILLFSVDVGSKPDSTPYKDCFLIGAYTESTSFQVFPRLCTLLIPKTTRSHIISDELYTFAWKRDYTLAGGDTFFHVRISTVSKPGRGHPL